MILTFFVFSTILYGINAQWYIIKKDYPSHLMNYPNPGKRSISEDNFRIDCSLPYSYYQTTEEKTAWLYSCSSQISPLDDSSLYYAPRLISHERRTPRSIPPYIPETRDLFNRILLNRYRRSTNK